MEYFQPEPHLFALLDYQEIDSYRVCITGNFSMKEKSVLTRYECRDGEFSSEEIRNIFIPIADTLTFYAFAPQRGSGEVRLGVMADGGRMAFSTFEVSDPRYILLETYLDTPLSPDGEIPLIGYTSGITIRREIDGMMYSGSDYCGLRDAATHPSEWFGKHRVEITRIIP